MTERTYKRPGVVMIVRRHIQNEEPALVKLDGDLALVHGFGGMGPGTIRSLDSIHPDLCEISCQMQVANQGGAAVITQRFQFDIDDVLWVGPAPDTDEGPASATPSGGGIITVGGGGQA